MSTGQRLHRVYASFIRCVSIGVGRGQATCLLHPGKEFPRYICVELVLENPRVRTVKIFENMISCGQFRLRGC
jgi:hypothetical protein